MLYSEGFFTMQNILIIGLVLVMVVVLIVLPMLSNKKRNKAVNDLYSSLKIGDVIKTVGGVIGTIEEIREISPVDKEIVLKSGVGDSATTLVFDIQAVYMVVKHVDAPIVEDIATADSDATAENVAEIADAAEEVKEEIK